MKTIAFILYLYLFLLGGGQTGHAALRHIDNPQFSTQNFSKKHPVKSLNRNQDSTFIEDTDFDIEEEHSGVDEYKSNLGNKFFAKKGNIPTKWKVSLARRYLLNDHCKRTNIFPAFCGHSSPIYITQRVLRI